jgi:capsular exopolysaccharide synthesis family protein
MTETLSRDVPNAGPSDIVPEIRAYLAILKRRWRIVAIAILVCLTIAVLYLARTKRYYEASTRVLILQQGGRPLQVGGVESVQSSERADDLLATHGMIVASPLVVSRAIESIGLERLPSLKDADNPVKQAIKQLKVTRPDRMAHVLQISYRAQSPDEATQMAKALTSSYSSFLEESYETKSGEVITLITKARDELSRDVAELEKKYLEFRQNSKVLIVDKAGTSFVSQRLDHWDHAASEMRVKAIQLKAQLDLGRKLANEGTELWAIAHAISQLGGDATSLTTTLASRSSQNGTGDYIRQLEQEQQQLIERHGPEYSKVQSLQDNIARIRDRNRTSRGRVQETEVRDLLNSIDQSLKSVESMQAAIHNGFDGDRDEMKLTELDLLKEANLRSELERHQSLFNTVVDQLKQAHFVSDFSSISSQTIEPANAAKKPVHPRTSLTLALALMMGCIGGMGIATAVEWLDQRIRSLDELRKIFSLPVLGKLPQLNEAEIASIGEFGRLCQSRPRSSTAEAYRAVRTNLDFLRRNRDIQVLLVTSPHPGDGKSATASNLAISLAQAGRKVLLIDGDLRKPSQCHIHDVPRDPGFTHVLRGLCPAERVIQKTTVPGLDLITTGRQVPNPAEVLASPRLKSFLDEMRQEYDIVIVDSSPLLAVTDPSILSTAVDGIMLVVQLQDLKHYEAERVVEILSAVVAPTIGLVVNRLASEDLGTYGNGYGVYGTSSGADECEDEPVENSDEQTSQAISSLQYHSNGHNGSNGFSV